MSDKTIRVRARSVVGDIIFVMRDFRNEEDPEAVVDINGWEFQLIVKRSIDDADSSALFDLAGAVVVDVDGTFKFTLTTAHTSMPAGTYVGEIRWVKSGGFGPGIAPDDAWTVDYIVEPAVSQYPA